MTSMSEAIVVVWFLPVVLNIILPLTVLGFWLGYRLLTILRSALTVEKPMEEESRIERVLTPARN